MTDRTSIQICQNDVNHIDMYLNMLRSSIHNKELIQVVESIQVLIADISVQVEILYQELVGKDQKIAALTKALRGIDSEISFSEYEEPSNRKR